MNEKEQRGVLQIPAYLSGYKSLVNSLRLTFDVQETYTPETLVQIMKHHKAQQLGWLFFGVQQIQPEQLVDLPELKIEKGMKTPSQRLRNRLYVYYQERYADMDGFDAWYINEMDKIGQKYLEAIK